MGLHTAQPEGCLPWYPALRAPGTERGHSSAVAAVPGVAVTAGQEAWLPSPVLACSGGHGGMVVRARMSPPYVAGQKPFPWDGKRRLKRFHSVTAQCQHGGDQAIAWGCHSSGCLQQQCLTPTVAGGIAKWQKKTRSFSDLRLAAQELPSNVGICALEPKQSELLVPSGVTA